MTAEKKKFAVAESLRKEDIQNLRKKLGMTQKEFAEMLRVSKKTVERWEQTEDEITGPIVLLVKLLEENPQIATDMEIPEIEFPLRLTYMFKRDICTVIDVNEMNQQIRIHNYTKKLQYRAFGSNTEPSYEDYEEFLESRCFPRTRDKMKLQLKELDLPFYDPFLIVERTQGRMEEDDFWIKIERKGEGA